MQKIKGIWGKIMVLSLTKKIIYGVILIIVILVAYMIFKPTNNSANITTDTVKLMDLKQTVLATGQVTSNTDLNLSFFSSGIVRSVKVNVGDTVKAGQILATLDQGNELAALTQARGAVAGAQAKYQSLLDGASSDEINLSQIALDNAKRDFDRLKLQQELLVNNAYRNLLNSTLEVEKEADSSDYTAPTVSGNYNLDKEGFIRISVSMNGTHYTAMGLTVGDGVVNSIVPQPIGNSGLYIIFPTNETLNYTDWIITIPNKKAPNYISNNNAYEAALKTEDSVLGSAQALVDQRTAELTLKKAGARSADIDLAKANILTAQGQLESASANYEHTILRAPAGGTITRVDVKVGELTQALKDVMTVQDVNNVYLEANINEANITSIKVGAPIDITFDAFSTDQIFKGNIVKIDPASTIISGVVNYKITANILNGPALRPGMTANMTILVGEKNSILTIPSRAIIKDKTGKKTVRVVTDTKTKTYTEVGVTTGMEGDGGLTEITSGLTEGEEIVVLIKK
ncbi:MAG: efflux RND transporter periplasmic adaptor subunit [Candidatus Paceibacterota bacterium]